MTNEPSRSRRLFTSGLLRLGEFRCLPGDPLWSEENNIGDRHHVVLPEQAVGIVHRDGERVVATPNHAIFYDAHQSYRREILNPRGDHAFFVEVDPSLLREMSEPDGRAPFTSGFAFRFTHGPLDAVSWVSARLVVCHLLSGREADRLAVEETLIEIVHRTVAGAHRSRGEPGRRATVNPHSASAVEEAKERIAANVPENLSLEVLARELRVSPFHLARTFRRRTGYTMRGFRRHLRVRAAVARAMDSSERLGDVAADLGFASQSHLTDCVRATVGATPGQIRRAARRNALAASRKFLEDRPGAGA